MFLNGFTFFLFLLRFSTFLTFLVLFERYLETQKTAHWCIVRETQSNFCSALDFVYPEPCPQ